MRVLIALVAVLISAGCAAEQHADPPKPISLTAADLEKLRWIEGSWRGTGGGVAPFFERYRFENSTTLIVETLDGDQVKDTTRYELENAEFNAGSGNSRRVATAFDAGAITFTFTAADRGSFRWQRETADTWKAVITWPASGSRAAGERVYQLERWPR